MSPRSERDVSGRSGAAILFTGGLPMSGTHRSKGLCVLVRTFPPFLSGAVVSCWVVLFWIGVWAIAETRIQANRGLGELLLAGEHAALVTLDGADFDSVEAAEDDRRSLGLQVGVLAKALVEVDATL